MPLGICLINNNISDVYFLGIIFLESGMSLGCIWNDYNDKKFDAQPRTKNRLIASKCKQNQIIIFEL